MHTSRSLAGAHTVVVGAGQAGLATSYYLQRLGIAHVVLERGRVGESWRSERWDSFVLNTPNALNGLPGAPYDGPLPDGFWNRDELVRSFERYARRFELPIRAGVKVEAIAGRRGGGFVLRARMGAVSEEIRAQSVVIASGMMRRPQRPPFAAAISEHILQLDAASYRDPGALPNGPILVVGSGQSGCQIAEELQAAGRTVYLSTSRVGRIPRRYRGRMSIHGYGRAGSSTSGAANSPTRPWCSRPSRRSPASVAMAIRSASSGWQQTACGCLGASSASMGPA
jgi:putative flavoprotein involved in K+ transport